MTAEPLPKIAMNSFYKIRPALPVLVLTGLLMLAPKTSAAYTFKTLSKPSRTVAYDANGNWVATFTKGARKVMLAGPNRTFSESDVAYTVSHGFWVRSLPAPYDGVLDTNWLDAALQANDSGVADVLAIAMEYVADAPPIYDGSWMIAGDASYGPLQPDGTRQEGSDF